MPREEGPIETRSTDDLQRRFDFITRNSRVVREAIECMMILQELGRREMAQEAMAQQRAQARRTPANEAAAVQVDAEGRGIDNPQSRFNLNRKAEPGDCDFCSGCGIITTGSELDRCPTCLGSGKQPSNQGGPDGAAG